MSHEYTEQTDNRSKHSAFLMGALVILLCLVALTGATFALFTSDPEDGTIGIVTTAGNVKVDLLDASKIVETSLIGQTIEFDYDGDQEGILFEPGATFYTKPFRVRNVGDIPINFRMYISNDERMDMEEFENAFEFYITDDPTNPDAAVKMQSFVDRLEVGEASGMYYLVIKMKEHVGNDFQGHVYSGIGITVYAVQGNVKIEE